uniref:Signal recognition particle 72 kDa protein n=1 Tax=Pan troglodytes TaxID=9598 RepID=G2HEF2_PANTR|nr:signal recognition particle 72 kDa protein [Pan troglodytes]
MIMMRRGKQTFQQLLQLKAIGKKWFRRTWASKKAHMSCATTLHVH